MRMIAVPAEHPVLLSGLDPEQAACQGLKVIQTRFACSICVWLVPQVDPCSSENRIIQWDSNTAVATRKS